MSKKLIIAISAALLSTRMAGSVPDPDKAAAIDQIETLVEVQDLNGICEIASQNLCLTTGDAPLAVALRETLEAEHLINAQFGFQVAANNGKGKGRGYLPWGERPGKGRPNQPPKHPHIY